MTAAQSQKPAGELYVHRIEELREEIRYAMAAISGNQLRALEESLWRQEVLCTGLRHLLGSAQESSTGSWLNPQLQTSLAALHQTNLAYAELLRQAQVSNHLFATLCQSYDRPSHEGNGPTATRCSLEA